MKIIFCNNNLSGIYLFRKDILKHYINKGYEVIVIYPKSLNEQIYLEKISKYCKCIAINLLPNSQNPIMDFRLYKQLKALYKTERPDLVINFTIKPNIYSALAANSLGIRVIDMIAGLGYVFEGNSIKKKIVRLLYKYGLSKSQKVIVLNKTNYDIIADRYVDRHKLVLFEGGEGVNMDEYPYRENEFRNTRFLMVSRLLYDKGFQQFVDAAQIVKAKYPNVSFELLGGFSEDSPTGVKKDELQKYVDEGILNYLGETNDVQSYVLRNGTVVVVASYYMEGMNRALMEACSMGRPIITTDMPGCREMVDDGENGYCIEPRNSRALAEACIKFIELPREKKECMAKASYEKCKRQFDVTLVIKKYDELLSLMHYPK